MAVRWRRAAIRDLDRIDSWLSSLDHAKPDRVRQQIGAAISMLERLGDVGRPGREPGTREIVVKKAPYVIVYGFHDGDIDVLAVIHAAEDS
jgi:toxin ParE1/3/4